MQGLFYPLELAWTRLAADTSRRGAPRTYQGLLHCLQTTARLEGVPGAAPAPQRPHAASAHFGQAACWPLPSLPS